MKIPSVFIFVLLVCLMPGKLLSQTEALELYNSKGDLIANGTLLFATDVPTGKTINSDTLLVKNISGSVINLKVRKIEENMVSGAFSKFEALAQFLLPNETITPNSWELADGEFLPQSALFTASYYPQSIISTTNIIYSFLSVDNKGQVIDSVYVIYAFSNTSITPYNDRQEALYHRDILINCDPVLENEYTIDLFNHTSNSVAYRVGKTIIDSEEGHESRFWFGGIEYAVDENSSNGEGVEIAPHTSLSGENGFKAIFNPNGIDGNEKLSKVQYKFFNRIDGRDADYVTLTYNPSGVGFSKILGFSVSNGFPNPATDVFYLNYSLPKGKKAVLKLYHSNGNLVRTYQMEPHINSIAVNVEGLAAAIYFYIIELDGKAVGVDKIIIN